MENPVTVQVAVVSKWFLVLTVIREILTLLAILHLEIAKTFFAACSAEKLTLPSVHYQTTDTGLVYRAVCPFTPRVLLVLTAYPRMDGQAELTWVAGYIPS